ncbi:MAG TPA: DUF6318 family protein [Jatrophihabitantaceae bacterium]|jgi:hypothetical protein|nr:DUF6318 family protein [Jatrophihabitantaceae bacterium]
MVGVVLLAGCSGSTPGSPTDPGSSDPVSVAPSISSPVTSSPTSPPASVSRAVPADVPTTGPNLVRKGERPPVMPVLATKHTPAGAVAFAKFFIRTIDWGFATTSGAYMRHYFTKSCIECASHADGLDNTRKAGEYYLGSRFRIAAARSRPPGDADASVTVTFDLTSAEVLTNHGRFVDGDVAHTGQSRQFWLTWTSDGWRVINMRPTS